MSTLAFCMPAHGRLALARICMKQLRRTCDRLNAEGIEATVIVVAEDENLDTAAEFGFGTVRRDNRFLSRKFNDAIQLALDPAHNPRPFTHVVPIGSDDWVDHRIFLDLPPDDTMVGFQRIAIVREDGQAITCRQLRNAGGCGIRIYPAALLEPLGYRPADPDRHRACDTSIFTNLIRHHEHGMRIEHRHLHDHQIVDWKSSVEQLNSYETLAQYRGTEPEDPFDALTGSYPAEALEEMRAHYASQREAVAA